MPRNGSGTYTLPKPPFVPNTTISSADVNSDFSDVALALTGSVAANGETPLSGPLKFPEGTASFPSHTFAADLTTGMYYPGPDELGFSAGGEAALILDTSTTDGSIAKYGNGAVLSPVGIVSSFAGSTAPAGWFLCYGQAISRTSYPELFSVIGTTYGTGDGSTTFNLPDVRGRTSYGKDDMGGTAANRITVFSGVTLGAAGGVQTVTLSTSNLPAYTPSLNVSDGRTWTTNNLIWGRGTGGGFTLGASLGGADGLTLQPVSPNGGSLSVTANPQGGTDAPFTSISPGIIFNKIIFAGRV